MNINKNRIGVSFHKYWSSIVNKHRYYTYYCNKGEKKRSFIANGIDFIFVRSVILILSYLWFVYRTQMPVISIVLALAVTILISAALYFNKNKYYNKCYASKKREVIRAYLESKVDNMNEKDFKWFLTKLLLNMDGFDNIVDHGNYIEVDYLGKSTGIGFYHTLHSEHVSPSIIAEFWHSIKKRRFDRIFFITPGVYKKTCIEFIDKNNMDIHLLEGSDLLRMIEKSPMIPDNDTVTTLLEKDFKKTIQLQRSYKKNISSPQKIKSCIRYAFMFFLMGIILRSFFLYFMVLTGLFIAIALITYIISYFYSYEDADIVEKLTGKENEV